MSAYELGKYFYRIYTYKRKLEAKNQSDPVFHRVQEVCY